MLLESKRVLIDNHVHSEYSFDGTDKISDICEAAYKNNLKAITITDHCDINFDFDSNIRSLINKSYHDTLMMKNNFLGKLEIYTGIEVGQPLENKALAQEILEEFSFDFTLLSLHNLPNKMDFYFIENFTPENVQKLLDEYFNELIHTLEVFHLFDSLAHLTYPLRYVYLKSDIRPNLNLFADKIDKILKLLIENKKALEVNISGFAKGLNCTLPDADLIARYKSLGGEYVTIGSDAHKADLVGVNILRGIDIIKGCGFDCLTIFENHMPKLINI